MDTPVNGLSGPTPEIYSTFHHNLQRWENRIPWFLALTRLFTRKPGDYASYNCEWDEARIHRFRRFIAILNRNIVAMEEAMRDFSRDNMLPHLWSSMEQVLLKLAEAFGGSFLHADVEMALPAIAKIRVN